MWNCSRCEELIDSSLDVCWNCGTSSDGEADPDFKQADQLHRDEIEIHFSIEPEEVTQSDSESSTNDPPFEITRRNVFYFFGVSFLISSIIGGIGYLGSLPRTADEFYRRGVIRTRAENYQGAIIDLSRAIELRQSEGSQSFLPMMYAARAVAYNNLGNYEKSLSDVSYPISIGGPVTESPESWKLVAISSRVPRKTLLGCYLLRANALVSLGQKEKAISDLNIILKSDPKNKNALNLLEIAKGEKK